MHRLWKDAVRAPGAAARGRGDPRHGRRHRRHRLPPRPRAAPRSRSPTSIRTCWRSASSARRSAAASRAWSGPRRMPRRLSFADRSFDAYTIAFGIRNVTHIDRALAEAHRVLKTGGRFFCLEFSTDHAGRASPTLYRRLFAHVVPRIGKAVARDEDSYRYLIESIRALPRHGRPSPAMIGKAGFAQVKAEPILGGLVAIHSGWKIADRRTPDDPADRPCLAAAEMGPGAGAARRAARHRARPQHAAAGAAAGADRPLRRAHPATSRPMPRPSRRSARRRSSSARRWRPGPIWSARRRRATSSCCRTACRRRRSRRSARRSSRALERPIEELFSRHRSGAGRRRLDRPGPPRDHHRRPPGRGQGAAARHRGGFRQGARDL